MFCCGVFDRLIDWLVYIVVEFWSDFYCLSWLINMDIYIYILYVAWVGKFLVYYININTDINKKINAKIKKNSKN